MTKICSILFIALVIVFFLRDANAAETQARQQKNNVIVSVAKSEAFSDKIEALGTLRANETVTLMATVTQSITAINFTDGQRVQKGDVLVEMASGQEKAQLEQERALLAEAGQQLDRIRPLVRQGAASKAVLDEAQGEFNTAKARLQGIQSRLKDYLIVAPFDGVVGLRNISVGTLIQPGTKITTLDDDNVMKLDFAIPSVFLPSIKTNSPIIATAREFPGQKFKGNISSIDSQIDPVTRSITVRAIIPNEDHALKPGLLMNVELFSNQRNALVIPEGSLVPEGKDNYVFVVPTGKNSAERRKVTIGTRRPGQVEIIEGLKAGEKIITRGANLRPGQLVNVVAEENPGESLDDIVKKISPHENQQSESER